MTNLPEPPIPSSLIDRPCPTCGSTPTRRTTLFNGFPIHQTSQSHLPQCNIDEQRCKYCGMSGGKHCVDCVRDALGDASKSTKEGVTSPVKCTCRNARRTLQNNCPVHFPTDALTDSCENVQELADKVTRGDDWGEIPDNYELTQRIETSLAYFCDEFPKDKGDNHQIWASPVDFHCQGVTPDDLQTILSLLYATRRPVSVSLEKCSQALYSLCDGDVSALTDPYESAKAVLDAAGVKYGD